MLMPSIFGENLFNDDWMDFGFPEVDKALYGKHANNVKKGKYIRKERYAGAMSRSFYVGEGVTQEDIKAKYEDGILRLSVPKKEAKAVENKKYIAIEG